MRVWVDHDGGVDDLLATMIAARSGDLVGVSVTGGTCFADFGARATAKMLAGMGHTAATVVVARCAARGVNPFPRTWRGHATTIDDFPFLNTADIQAEAARMLSPLPGEEALADALERQDEPLTIVATGPLSAVAWVLENRPAAAKNIASVLVMGGAVRAPGNVEQPGHDGSAEWNFYWDPPAARAVFESGVPVVLFPLDVTNRVPITHEFVQRFAARWKSSFCSLFAGTAWSLTTAKAHTCEGSQYYAWDALTALYLSDPSKFTTEKVSIAVVASGDSQGRSVVRSSGEGSPECLVAFDVDKNAFYDGVVRLLS